MMKLIAVSIFVLVAFAASTTPAGDGPTLEDEWTIDVLREPPTPKDEGPWDADGSTSPSCSPRSSNDINNQTQAMTGVGYDLGCLALRYDVIGIFPVIIIHGGSWSNPNRPPTSR